MKRVRIGQAARPHSQYFDNRGGLSYNPGGFLEVSSPCHTVKPVWILFLKWLISKKMMMITPIFVDVATRKCGLDTPTVDLTMFCGLSGCGLNNTLLRKRHFCGLDDSLGGFYDLINLRQNYFPLFLCGTIGFIYVFVLESQAPVTSSSVVVSYGALICVSHLDSKRGLE